jgi:hypothetical protein
MAARLDMKPASEAERDALLKALVELSGEGPLNRWKFEQSLRAKLKTALTQDQIDSMVTTHLPALLRICALPKW